MQYETFEEMPLWQQAHAFALRVHGASSSFPRQQDYGLTSQLRRAAVSIAANISEAFGRYHYGDKLNFYYHSRGSICEVRSHLVYARDVGYIARESFNELTSTADLLMEQVNAVIASLRRRQRQAED